MQQSVTLPTRKGKIVDLKLYSDVVDVLFSEQIIWPKVLKMNEWKPDR